MTRFDVALVCPKVGLREHRIPRPTRDAAIAKAEAAYPGCKVLSVTRAPIFDDEPDNRKFNVQPPKEARDRGNRARAETMRERVNKGQARMIEAIPPEGIGTTALAKAASISGSVARNWCRDLEAQGRVTRHHGQRGYMTIRRADL